MSKFYERCNKCDGPNGRRHRWCRTCLRDYNRENFKGYRFYSDEQKRKAIARAYAKVYKQRGHLISKPCELCGNIDVEMHHPDYSKPLDVRWLCTNCHRWVHTWTPGRFPYFLPA